MGKLTEMIAKLRGNSPQFREDLKEAQNQVRIQKLVENRMKHPEEVELEKYIEEERQKQIHEAVEFHREKRKHESEIERNPLNAKNMFKDSDFEILKQKNLFSDNKNTLKQRNLFKGG
jgi:hypothetical protein